MLYILRDLLIKMGCCSKFCRLLWDREPLIITIPVNQEIYCKKSALTTEFFLVCGIIALIVSYSLLEFHLQQTVTVTTTYADILSKKLDPVNQQCLAKNVSVAFNSFVEYDYNEDYSYDCLIEIPNLTHDKYMWISCNTATYNLLNKLAQGWAINSDYIVSKQSIINTIQQSIVSDDFMIWNIETDTMLVSSNLLWKIKTIMGWVGNATAFNNTTFQQYNIFVADQKYLPVIASQMIALLTINYEQYLANARPYDCIVTEVQQDSTIFITGFSLIGANLSIIIVIGSAFVNWLDGRQYAKMWEKYKKGENKPGEDDPTKISKTDKAILRKNVPHYAIAMGTIDEQRAKGENPTDSEMQHVLKRSLSPIHHDHHNLTPQQLQQAVTIANLIVSNPALTAHLSKRQLTTAQVQRVSTMAQIIQNDPELSFKLPQHVTGFPKAPNIPWEPQQEEKAQVNIEMAPTQEDTVTGYEDPFASDPSQITYTLRS